ncbi:MAG: trypsin-like peptidase domain-containing protein, partial [Planctomycetes bacterium]|nr:trypsin-like peptidase domain-containing protein [Planctomycetota bacterium]
MGRGSGFIIDESGVIVTNSHVVEGAEHVKVRLHDGREFIATDIKQDPRSDIAILHIDAPGGLLKPVRFGNSDQMQVGDWVLAVGSPFGYDLSVTAGIISAKGRGPRINEREDYLQTDAAINPGNSGGPLLNLNGEVIGINTAISSRNGSYNGIGFAVPINMAQWVIQQLVAEGKVTRAYLGVKMQPIDAALSRSLKIPIGEGVIVAELARLARLPVDSIHLDSILDTDLGLDSLMRVELLMLLESKLRKPIPDNIVAEMRTVRDVIEAIQGLQSQTADIPPDQPIHVEPPKTTHGGTKLGGLFRFGMRVIYRRYFSFKCGGLEHIPLGKPYIIAPNHTSHLDTPAIMTALGNESKRLCILGARDYWFSSNRFKSWFARTCLNILPLDRAGNFLQDVRIAKEALLQG